MFKKSNIQFYDEFKVSEFNRIKVIDIEKMDRSIFRTEYLRNKFSMIEYVDRLEEVYHSNNKIEKKIYDYLSIENCIKSDLEQVSSKDKKFLYFSIGFYINKILERLKIRVGYKIYNYGVYENNDLIVAYFDLTMKKYNLDLTDFKEMLCKILKVEENTVVFNKNGEVYELILYKKDFLTVDYSTLFNITDFEDLEDEGYRFPLIVGKDESLNNTYLDLERNNSMLILGDAQSGKTNMLNLLLMNMICLYSEDEISIVMLDKKDKEFNRNFSYSPHFIGYHNNVEDYISILKEIKREMGIREDIIESANVEIWQDLRDYLIKEEEYDLIKAFPWIVVTIDEMLSTMEDIKGLGSSKLKEFEDLLSYIVKYGRRYGIKIIMVSENDKELGIPRVVLDEVAMKIFFKVNGNDFNGLINEHYIDPPSLVGEFVLDDKDNIYPVRGKSAVLGLNDDEKLNYLIRTVSVDMLRAVEKNGEVVYRSPVFVKSNNRDTYIDSDIFNKESLFHVKKNTKVFDIANDLLKGVFKSSKYK